MHVHGIELGKAREVSLMRDGMEIKVRTKLKSAFYTMLRILDVSLC